MTTECERVMLHSKQIILCIFPWGHALWFKRWPKISSFIPTIKLPQRLWGWVQGWHRLYKTNVVGWGLCLTIAPTLPMPNSSAGWPPCMQLQRAEHNPYISWKASYCRNHNNNNDDLRNQTTCVVNLCRNHQVVPLLFRVVHDFKFSSNSYASGLALMRRSRNYK